MATTRQLLQAGISRREIRQQSILQRRLPSPSNNITRQIDVTQETQSQTSNNKVNVGGETFSRDAYNLVSQYIEDKAMGKRGTLASESVSKAERDRLLNKLLQNPRVKEAFEGGQGARIRSKQLGFNNVKDYIGAQGFASGVQTQTRIQPSTGLGTSQVIKKGSDVFAPDFNLSTAEGLRAYAQSKGTPTQSYLPERKSIPSQAYIVGKELAFGETGKELVGVTLIPSITNFKPDITATKIKQFLSNRGGITGKFVSEFIPETPFGVALYGGTAAVAGGLGVVGKSIRGGFKVIGVSTALNPELPTEKRIAGAVMAGALTPFRLKEFPSEIRIPLREPRATFIEFQRPANINGKKTTISSFRITTERTPPTKVFPIEIGKQSYIDPAKLEITKTVRPFLDKQPAFTLTTKGGNTGQLEFVSGSFENVPTTLSNFQGLPKTQQFLWQRVAEGITGRPISLKRVPLVLSKNTQKAQGLIQEFRFGNIKKSGTITEINLLEPKTLGKRTSKFEVVSETQPSLDTGKFEIAKSEIFFKDVTNPLARATGKTPKLTGLIVRAKEQLVIDTRPSFEIITKEPKLTLYHSTPKENLPSIFEVGLKPSSQTGIKQGIAPKEFVSLGTSSEIVSGFGYKRFGKIGGEVEKLKIEIPKSEAEKLVYKGTEPTGIGEVRLKEVPVEYIKKTELVTKSELKPSILPAPKFRPQKVAKVSSKPRQQNLALLSEVYKTNQLDSISLINLEVPRSETKLSEAVKIQQKQFEIPITKVSTLQLQKPAQQQKQKSMQKLMQKQKLNSRFELPRILIRSKPKQKPKETKPFLPLPRLKTKKKKIYSGELKDYMEPIVFPVGFTARAVGATQQITEKQLLRLANNEGDAIGIRARPIIIRKKNKATGRKR